MFGTIGMPEILLLLVIVVIIFGASRLPQLGRGLGEGIRNLRSALRGGGSNGEERGSKEP